MIVIDASTIVSAALIPDSLPWRALMQARAIDILAFSEPVVSEIVEVLARPKFARRLQLPARSEFQNLLFRNAAWFEPTIRVSDCRDPKDNKYLELVLAATAGALITSDSDLRDLHPWRGIPVMTPREFLLRP